MLQTSIARFLSLLTVLLLMEQVIGHGMMLVPPNRSSLWRFNKSAPINYDDNQNFCGGFSIQWGKFGGKCGLCGDRFDDPHPQNNENGGKYGKGLIAARYTSGSVINVDVLLTANHKGYFKYSLCVLKDFNGPEPGEDCFRSLTLADGSPKYNVNKSERLIRNQIKLPDKVNCERCVLRWDYTAGNNWGNCNDGTSGLGCGPQETFRSCADIQIL